MMGTAIVLYAELLPNIRQISVTASFVCLSNSSTKAHLDAKGSHFTVRHNGKDFHLPLPGLAIATTQLQKPVLNSKEFSWRLPLARLDHCAGPKEEVESAQYNAVPWSAGTSLDFLCRGCDAIIVPKNNIESWRDLPSDNWAEMMDFWHCHKPDVEGDHENGHVNHDHKEDPNANRAYGANSRFIAQTRVGFIDLTSFLLVGSDCQNTQTITKDESEQNIELISCKSCNAPLGNVDQQACGIRLHKWRLAIRRREDPYYTNLTSVIVSAKILSIIRAQCTSKALLLPASSSSSKILYLWILQQSIFYSRTQDDPRRTFAMKVLWKRVSREESNELIDNGKAEDIILPNDAIVEIENRLQASREYLPSSARIFQGWEVGYLERYWEGYSVGERVGLGW